MIDAPRILARPAAKAAGSSASPAASAATAADDAAESSGNAALAAQQQAFNLTQSEDAELQRELAALDDMLMAQVKDEDEILKKWIAMI